MLSLTAAYNYISMSNVGRARTQTKSLADIRAASFFALASFGVNANSDCGPAARSGPKFIYPIACAYSDLAA